MSRYIKVSNEDGTFTNEKCYTPADMEAFAKWLGGQNLWFYDYHTRSWHKTSDYEFTHHNFDDVLESWRNNEEEEAE